MAISKCVKCGADIPEEAAFCPSCGAPKATEPAPQSTAAAPQPATKEPSSIPDMLNSLFSETNIYVMILLGILIASIGGLMFIFAGDLTVYRIGIILNILGFLFMGVFLLMGGIVNKNFDNYVRFGMTVGGAIMITWSLAIPA